MRTILLTALVVNFLTWKYEKMDQDTIKSQDKEKESEKALTTLTEQMKNTENLTVQLQPQFQKVTDSREAGGDGGGEPEREAGNSQNLTKRNQKDQIDGTMDDIIEKEKEELVKTNTQLQKELLNKEKYCEDKVTTLMEEKTELEKQRDSLQQRLDELEREKENFTKQNQKDQMDDTKNDIIEKEKEELVKKIAQLQMELLNKDKYWEDKVTTLMEEKTELENQRDSLKQRLDECEKKKENNTMQIQKDRLFFEPDFTALDLDTVFFILLIHICGADLVQSISTLSQHVWLIGVLAELAFSFILYVYAKYKWKKLEKQREEMEKQREELEKEKDIQEKPREEPAKQKDAQEKLREELEKQRQQLVEQLDENEKEREENKQKLQSVEREITEREKMFDKPEELLREKENLLQAQWKLDETKKILEKQILDREKLLEAIENLLRSN